MNVYDLPVVPAPRKAILAIQAFAEDGLCMFCDRNILEHALTIERETDSISGLVYVGPNRTEQSFCWSSGNLEGNE